MRYGLRDEEIEAIQKILHKHHITKATLFGSRAKGTYKHGSDIDLAIEKKDLTLSEILDIMVEIEELYLPCKIDIIDINSISNKDLLKHIGKVGVALDKTHV